MGRLNDLFLHVWQFTVVADSFFFQGWGRVFWMVVKKAMGECFVFELLRTYVHSHW
jgi:hypothetical protein